MVAGAVAGVVGPALGPSLLNDSSDGLEVGLTTKILGFELGKVLRISCGCSVGDRVEELSDVGSNAYQEGDIDWLDDG